VNHVAQQYKLNAQQKRQVASALAADISRAKEFGGGVDGHLKVEMARIAQEFAATGKASPTKGDFIRELVDRFPDQESRIRANIDAMMADVVLGSNQAKERA
jgi:hypothetical protein